jgi:ACS family hexuronate transporter-like MFS transporter
VATLVMAVSYVDRQSFAALSPTICKALGIDEAQYGLVTAAFSVAYLVGAPLAGWLVDSAGARRGLVGSVLAWSAVAALHALVPSFGVLFALRIALGASESPSFPAAAQAVQRSLPPEHRAAGFGLLFTGSSIGGMIAAPLAIGLSRVVGWRFAFVGTALVGLSWVPLWIGVTSSPAARHLLDDVPEAVPVPDQRQGHGLGELARLMTMPPVQRAILLVLVSAPTVNFVYNWLPKYLVAERGLTQNGLARYLWAPPLLFDAGAVVFGAIASAVGGVRSDLVAAGGLACACVGLMPLASGPVVTVSLASVALFGAGACFALLTSDVLSKVDRGLVSRAGGLCAASQSLAYVAGNLLTGVILRGGGTYRSILYVLGAIVVPGTALWIVWPGASAAAPRGAKVTA